MKLSIVIPCKADEPRLMQTLGSIAGTAPNAEIIVVFDGCPPAKILPGNVTVVTLDQPRGTQYARHAGIMAATGGNIFTCDAHMDFQPGWATVLRFHLQENPRSVCCFKMCALEPEHNSWMEARSVFKGASINWMTRAGGFHGALVGKWADNHPGQISCVMGACYGFRKERYLEINKPWRLGTGWGCDEETISAVNWLCGGSIDLLDHYIGHYMGKSLPASVKCIDMLWANRLRLIRMLPMRNSLRAELIHWLEKNELVLLRENQISEHLQPIIISGFRIAAPWERSVEDWIEHFELKPKKEVQHA